MPASMTSFARVEFDGDWGRGAWELRSVNHRYGEVTVRLPEDFRRFETAVRERVSGSVRRGKVDCTLRLETANTGAGEIVVNREVAAGVVRAAGEIATLSGETVPVDPLEVLRWPGVTETPALDVDAVGRAVLTALDDALDEFLDTRRREGEKMADAIRARLEAIGGQLEMLETRVPDIMAAVTDRYRQRIAELASGLDEARVEQECALLVQRLDVAEELDRLAAHVSEVARVLEADEPIGRRLDFLMQELNREANTLGSKSAHVDTAGASVELKVLIEQMREQVQNIE